MELCHCRDIKLCFVDQEKNDFDNKLKECSKNIKDKLLKKKEDLSQPHYRVQIQYQRGGCREFGVSYLSKPLKCIENSAIIILIHILIHIFSFDLFEMSHQLYALPDVCQALDKH